MYSLLTKQPNGSFDLPELWRGTSVNAELQSHFDDTLSRVIFKHPVTEVDRATKGLFPHLLAPRPVGEIHTSAPDTFDGATVQENVTSAPDTNYVAPDPFADMLAAQIVAVKTEAGRRIVAIIPEWKQRNLTARAAMLGIKGVSNWTSSEQDEFDAGLLLWGQVDAIRTRSDVIEIDLAAMTMEQLQTFDAVDELNWV